MFKRNLESSEIKSIISKKVKDQLKEQGEYQSAVVRIIAFLVSQVWLCNQTIITKTVKISDGSLIRLLWSYQTRNFSLLLVGFLPLNLHIHILWSISNLFLKLIFALIALRISGWRHSVGVQSWSLNTLRSTGHWKKRCNCDSFGRSTGPWWLDKSWFLMVP